jgi:hypothetical protein
MDLTIQRAKENVLPIWRPFNESQLSFDLLAPEALAIHGAHNYSTILIDDANFLAIRAPLHITDDTSISIVDHLLEPDAAVEHPNDDQAILVACSELSKILVPSYDHDIALVALERLVHGQVALGATSSLPSIFRRRLQFQHFEQATLATTRDPTLCTVPSDHLQSQVVGYGDFLAQVHEHLGQAV